MTQTPKEVKCCECDKGGRKSIHAMNGIVCCDACGLPIKPTTQSVENFGTPRQPNYITTQSVVGWEKEFDVLWEKPTDDWAKNIDDVAHEVEVNEIEKKTYASFSKEEKPTTEDWELGLAELLVRADVAVNYPQLEKALFDYIRTLITQKEEEAMEEAMEEVLNEVRWTEWEIRNIKSAFTRMLTDEK